MATELRKLFNRAMREDVESFQGSCLYVGGSDNDKEGSRYQDYAQFSEFRTLDIQGNPDFLCSIEHPTGVPVFDLVIMCWVIEHVLDPYSAMVSARALSKRRIIIAYPVLHPRHADPIDLYRFLPGYSRAVLNDVDVYREVSIRADGIDGQVDFCSIGSSQ